MKKLNPHSWRNFLSAYLTAHFRTSCSIIGTSSIYVLESFKGEPNFANTQAPLLISGGIEDLVHLRIFFTKAQISSIHESVILVPSGWLLIASKEWRADYQCVFSESHELTRYHTFFAFAEYKFSGLYLLLCNLMS